jgi:hypothetical protein
MDARRGKLVAALAAATMGVAAFAGAAQAATVTSHPPQYVQPSAGPFTWTFAPSVADAPVAWKLSSETAWHRCTTDTSATFATLPEGTYSISVADDDPSCAPSDTTAPAGIITTTRGTSNVTVDGTPPVVPVPVVTAVAPGRYKIDAFAAHDALSGIASFTWIDRDGLPPRASGRLSSITSSYPVGTFPGAVTVVDRAGNAATQGFTVTSLPAPPVVAPPDVTSPAILDVRLRAAVLQGHVLPVSLTLSERATATITASIRAAGHTYRLAAARRTLLSVRPSTVRVPVKAAVRRAIARALRRHRPVRATVAIVAVDRAGNRRSATSAARITG